MKIFVYLDESGSIHKNSSTKYFAVGGYFSLEKDNFKVISKYEEINLDYKKCKNISLDKEIKGRSMPDLLKKKFFLELQSIESFYGVAKIFDKSKMRKSILLSNIFYNYAVRLIFDDCIIPLLSLRNVKERIEFIISLDNRNLAVRDLNNLEEYLNMEYSKNNFLFKVTYYDSKDNFGVQVADLVVNTFYNYYKNKRDVESIYNILTLKKFRISEFPGKKTRGRRYKITM